MFVGETYCWRRVGERANGSSANPGTPPVVAKSKERDEGEELDTDATSGTEGSLSMQRFCERSPSQQWSLVPTGSNGYAVKREVCSTEKLKRSPAVRCGGDSCCWLYVRAIVRAQCPRTGRRAGCRPGLASLLQHVTTGQAARGAAGARIGRGGSRHMRRTDLPSSSRVLQLGSVGRQQRSQFGPRADGVVSFFLFIYLFMY